MRKLYQFETRNGVNFGILLMLAAVLCLKVVVLFMPIVVHLFSKRLLLRVNHDLHWKLKQELLISRLMRPGITQISLGIRQVWSESLLSVWRNIGSSATHWTRCEDSLIRLGGCLHWVHSHFECFVLRRLIFCFRTYAIALGRTPGLSGIKNNGGKSFICASGYCPLPFLIEFICLTLGIRDENLRLR